MESGRQSIFIAKSAKRCSTSALIVRLVTTLLVTTLLETHIKSLLQLPLRISPKERAE